MAGRTASRLGSTVVGLLVLACAVAPLNGCGAATGAGRSYAPASTASTIDIVALDAARSAEYLADGESVTLSHATVKTTGSGQGGVMAVHGGSLTLDGVVVVTEGHYSTALATGEGGGSIKATGGRFEATESEAAVVEGAGSVVLSDAIVSSKRDAWAVRIFQSAPPGVSTAAGSDGTSGLTGGSFAMDGGSLVYTARSGSLFYVTDGSGSIALTKVDVLALCETLLTSAAGSWGPAGSNGGAAVLVAHGQILTGDIVADAISTVDITLEHGSSLMGAIDPAGTAKEADLTLDATSVWKVTADSHLTGLTLSGGVPGDTIENIKGGGHTVYYDPGSPASSGLGGKTYKLSGGGNLTPRAGSTP